MDTGFEARHLYAACKLTFTHYFEPGDQSSEVSGTGFVVGFPDGDTRFGLVTNRHLVDRPWSDSKYNGAVLKSVHIEMWQSDVFRALRF
jgi:hypothetical protein